MLKSILFIPELEYALQYWEDRNLIAENLFSLSVQKKWKLNELAYQNPLIGSEVDDEKNLRRSIKNFTNLRTCVESNIDFDSTLFLPRVPKDRRENYTQINFLREGLTRPITFFPYFLSEWLKFKKVYALYGAGIIPKIDPQEKNFLPLVPYDSFIIKFDQPVNFTFDKIFDDQILNVGYSSIMIVFNRQDEVIDVLLIPTEVKSWLLGAKERQVLQKKNKGQLSKIEFLGEIGFWGASIDSCDGFNIKSIIHKPDNAGGDEQQIVYKYDLQKGYENARKLYSDLIATVNGFCKLISELEPPRSSLEPADVLKEATAEEPRDYEWDSVPITQVRNLKKLGYEIHISYGGKGTEKSPHWRRGHWRRNSQKDGSIRKIWIEQVLVREDKLETENLLGSATLIKDE